MKSHLMRGLAVAILAIPLLIASCSKKDKGTNPGTAPVLTVPSIAQAVNFVGTDPAIQSAKDKVHSEIALASPIFATVAAFATAANSGSWGTKTVDGCWSKSSSQGNCTTAHKVCDGSSGSSDWTRTLNGNCSGTDHANWVSYDGNTAADGGAGMLRLYKSNTADIDSLWAWSTAADKNSKDWNVYKGAASTANLIASVHWSKGAGGSANTWTFEKAGTSTTLSAGASSTDPAKWELHASTDAKTGSMDIYQWQAAASPAAFYRSDHIGWNPDSTGTWQVYNAEGTLINETKWPVTLPDVVIPDLGHDVVITSTDQCAQIAKLMAQSQVSIVQAFASLGTTFVHVFDSLQQGNQVDGCWSWTTPYLSCSATYKLCEESGGFHWSLIYDGNCGTVPYDHWVVIEGTISSDGRNGTWTGYEDGTTTVNEILTWSTSADGKAGTLDLYNGAVSEANHEEQITWSTAADGATDLTVEYLGSSPSKWVTHVSADGTSGYSRSYSWDENPPAHYWLQSEIIWNSDGSGSQNSYLEDGTVIPDCSWT